MKYRSAGDVQRPSGAIFYAAFGGENHTTALRAMEMHSPPLVSYGTTFPPQNAYHNV